MLTIFFFRSLNELLIFMVSFLLNDLIINLKKSFIINSFSSGRIQPGMITIFANIIRQEQIVGLWRGMVPSVARCVPGVGLYFSSLHWLKGKMGKSTGDLKAIEAVLLGVVARTMSGIALIPITVIKTR